MPDPARDYSIFCAIAAALEATGEFRAVVVGEKPDVSRTQFGAQATPAAVVSPLSFREPGTWDDFGDESSERTGQTMVTLVARSADESERIDLLDRLAQVAANAINGQRLAGITLPGKTRVAAGNYLPAADPEKHLILTVEWSYLIGGYANHDDGEFQE